MARPEPMAPDDERSLSYEAYIGPLSRLARVAVRTVWPSHDDPQPARYSCFLVGFGRIGAGLHLERRQLRAGRVGRRYQ